MSAPANCYAIPSGSQFYFYTTDSQTYGFDIYDYQYNSSNGGWHGCSGLGVPTTTSYTMNFSNYSQMQYIYGRCRDINNNWTYSGGITNPYYVAPTPTCPTPNAAVLSVNATQINIVYDATAYNGNYTIVSEYRIGANGELVTAGAMGSYPLSGIPNGTTFYIYYKFTKSGYNDSTWSTTSSIYITLPTCPTPAAVGISLNADSTRLIFAYDSRGAYDYTLWVAYNLNMGTNTYMLATNMAYCEVSSIPDKSTLYVNCKFTKEGYTDSSWSGWTYWTKPVSRPSNSTYFDFTSDQSMTVANQVKIDNTHYTCDTYVMPASTWNLFTAKINEFRAYKNLSNYTFTQVASGDSFSYTYINQANLAIYDMDGITNPIYASADISASTFMNLQNRLNLIQ